MLIGDMPPVRGSLLISEVKDMAAEDILGARRDWPCIEGEGEWFMTVNSEGKRSGKRGKTGTSQEGAYEKSNNHHLLQLRVRIEESSVSERDRTEARQRYGILNLKSHELERSGQRDNAEQEALAMKLRAETAMKASTCE